MKPSVDGRRGDRSGWKLVGNSSKWERPVGETTQDGARISHYRQNQNNPTLTKSRQTRAPFSVYMRDVGNFQTKIHSVQIRDTYFISRAVRCDVFSDIFVNIFICRSIRLRSVYIGAAWIPAIKLALFTFISLQRLTPMPTRIGNSFSKSKNIFFGQNSWRTGGTCWLSSARGGRVTP